MKRTLVGIVCLFHVFAFGSATLFADRPNIVFMLADDQGWNGTSVQMHPTVSESKGQYYQTPNLEKLASQGMRFSQGYSPAPVCSPTRISLQTGKSPAQLHWTKAAPPVEGMKLIEPKLIKSISRDEVTIAELLRRKGYSTAHYGKWHISGGGPGEHGYDEHDGDTGNENAFKFVDPNPVDIFGMADRAKQFMAKSKAAGKPFLIQLSWNALHASENASKAALEKYKKLMSGANDKAIATAAITEDLDRGVGEVMNAIDQLGLADSTYVIYMSDNGGGAGGAGNGGGGGGGGKKGGLRGGKGGVWEGGLRVPMIVRGPGVASNSWCHVPVVGYDFFPTFCQWAGVDSNDVPISIEGGSLKDLLANNGQGAVRRRFHGLAFHFPHYQGEGPQSSIQVGTLKLVHSYEDDRDSLFDLSQDISERNDLAKSQPQEVAKLRRDLESYLTAVNAQLPTLNPNFDPKSQPSTQEMRGKRGGGQNNKPQEQGLNKMLRKTVQLAALIALTFSSSVSPLASAHEDGHGFSSQAFTLFQKNDGTHFHGSFISADDVHWRFITENGAVQLVPLEQLSQRSLLWIVDQQLAIERLNTRPAIKLVSVHSSMNPAIENTEATNSEANSTEVNTMPNPAERPMIAASFSPFEKTVGLRWDRDYLYVESNGIPEHQMMVGIRSWQQQVPLPQAYRGDNAWCIPLNPVPAKKPASAKGQFLRGAIALAVNGIPIFNPLNNRGDDAYLFGELDEFGGHCGRADDYHYHIAPIHLEKIVGKGQPIAYALDGYPILGYQDPGSPDFAPLDWLNGHKDAQGNYHYHATPKYPYINGGFYGQVIERDGQVDPQPRAEPVRPALPPMPGAKITDFQQSGQISTLTYEMNSKPGTVRYMQRENGSVDFEFTDITGKSKSESFQTRGRQPGQRRGGGPERGGPERGGPERGGPERGGPERGGPERGGPERGGPERPGQRPGEPERDINRPKPTDQSSDSTNTISKKDFALSSSSIDAKGFLLVDCTCDGKKQSPALAWSNLPAETKTIAVSLWHTAPDQEKSYWLAYNIPADVKSIEQNGLKSGTLGLNDKKRAEYDPMCSKGPGVKTYHITVYALSSQLDVKPNQMTRKRLLDEVKKHQLGESTLDFKYERK